MYIIEILLYQIINNKNKRYNLTGDICEKYIQNIFCYMQSNIDAFYQFEFCFCNRQQ